MKIILNLLPIFLLLSCGTGYSSNTSNLTDWERLNLKGKVKKVIRYNWYAEGDFGEFGKEASDTGRLSYVALFNEKGYLIEESDYANSEYRSYTHKDLTQRQEMKVYALHQYMGHEGTEGGLRRTHKYEYNDKNQLILETIINEQTKQSLIRKYEYDVRGNRTLDYSPVFGAVLKLEYNDKGQAIKYWAYDSQQNYEKDRNATVGYRKYDAAGNMIEQGYNGFKRIFRYDDHKNMIERTSVHRPNDIRQRLYTYKYDVQNNWIMMSKKNNRYLNEQKLTYF